MFKGLVGIVHEMLSSGPPSDGTVFVIQYTDNVRWLEEEFKA